MVWQIYSSREFSELSELVKDKADDSKSIYIYNMPPPSHTLLRYRSISIVTLERAWWNFVSEFCTNMKYANITVKALVACCLPFIYKTGTWNCDTLHAPLPHNTPYYAVLVLSVIEHVPAIIIYQLGLTDNVMLCSVWGECMNVSECEWVYACVVAQWGGWDGCLMNCYARCKCPSNDNGRLQEEAEASMQHPKNKYYTIYN